MQALSHRTIPVKLLELLFAVFIGGMLLASLTGCPATMQTGSPAQNAVNMTATSCKNIDAAIVAADQAVVSGVLKGQDARNALKGLTAAQAGCVTALTSIQAANAAAATSAASGAKP